MSEDLLKDSFCAEVNKTIISRHIKMLKIMLGLVAVYTVLQSIWWFKILSNVNYRGGNTADFFQYRVIPVFLITVVLANLMAWSYYLHGTALLKQSFIKNEAEMFNTGYTKIFTATVITVFCFTLSCLEVLAYLVIF